MIMKKLGLLLVGFIAVGSFSSCMKTDNFDPSVQYEIEKVLIEEYVQENLPAAQFHEESGIWYQLMGVGDQTAYEYKIVNERLEIPIVTVKYTGRLLNGSIFDDLDLTKYPNGIDFSLNGVISAWPLVFFPQKIGENDVGGIMPQGLFPGARIRFVTPSYLGYGNQQWGNIPANSPLDFTIEVIDVRAPTNN